MSPLLRTVRPVASFVVVFLVPLLALAGGGGGDHGGGGHHSLGETLPVWSVAPFAAMLGAIAVLPLVAGHWWHSNFNRGVVSAVLGIPIAIWMGILDHHVLLHTAHEYFAFLVLLGSLFVISGGIVVRGSFVGSPMVNTAIIGIGALLASFIGTTGASMLLIRPLLRANAHREKKVHVFVFFIFLVSNIGGLLTPLGDPPLFLGFLRGVPFQWTFSMFPQWLFLNSILLVAFFGLDTYLKEPAPKRTEDPTPFALRGTINFLYLGGVIAVILLSGSFHPPVGVQEAGMIFFTALSLWTTPQALRKENEFDWEPIIEVAVVFAGIFATMIPALQILNARGADLGLTEPWQYFWATGILSSFLDNAPTYLTFTATASGVLGTDGNNLAELLTATGGVEILTAISLGAVFMGANTYIGNGPNFMVKAVAEQGGVRMPSFFGYIAWSTAILIPMFLLVTFVFLL